MVPSGFHDVVLEGGRLIDPGTGLDGPGSVGITGDRITAVGEESLVGRVRVDVSGRVVCPGFVDLHSHGQGIAEGRLQALDGVTTALELEAGSYPVARAYEEAAADGRPIHYGFAASWAGARMRELLGGDPVGPGLEQLLAGISRPAWQGAATSRQVANIVGLLEGELADGALGIGVLVGYAPASEPSEYLAVARLAASAGVPTYTHARALVEGAPDGLIDGAEEIVQAAATTGAAMHWCHVNSTAARHVERALRTVQRAQAEGARVSVEAYPYASGMTGVGAAFLHPDRLAQLGMSPRSIRVAVTGERVGSAARLLQLREEGPAALVYTDFLDAEDPVDQAHLRAALRFPGAAMASDAIPLIWPAGSLPGGPDRLRWPLPSGVVTHPRSAGTFARTLRLVREQGTFDLPDAVRRCSLIPAQVVESAAPSMARKGRLQVGCDADVIVFDPDTVADRATYDEPVRPSVGIDHVLVAGTFVVRDGQLLVDALPGRPVRGSPA